MVNDEAPDRAGGSTRAVDRALRLLTGVVESESSSTLSELARAAGLSVSTTSRLLATLAEWGLVAKSPEGRYRAGGRMKQLAAATLREEPLYEIVGPHLYALVDETGETASLGVALGDDRVLYLRQVPGIHHVQSLVWTGRTISRSSALGAAIDGPPDPEQYRVNHVPGEDITAVAAPLVDHSDVVVGAISINAPTYRTGDADTERYGAALARHATIISSALGSKSAYDRISSLGLSTGRSESGPSVRRTGV